MKYLVLLVCFAAIPAFGAKLQTENLSSGPETVDLPLKGLESSHHMDENLTSSYTPPGILELKASSYQPKQLNLHSYAPNLSSFSNMGVPQIGISYFKALSDRWKLEIGTSLLALERTGTLNASGQAVTLEQDAYIAQIRAGANYFLVPLSRVVRPYLESAISPTLIVTKRSAVDDGSSGFGFVFEAGAGALVKISSNFDFDLFVAESLGSANTSNMQNFSIASGIRMSL